MVATTEHKPSSFLREAFGSNNRFVTKIALLAALGGFLFGYDTGVVSGALPYIERSFNLDALAQSWVVGSLLIGAVLGAAGAGKLADLISRRWTTCVGGCVFTVGALGSFLAPDVGWLIVFRFALGLAVGTASFVSPMYIAEHSPKHLRGGMAAFNQLMTQLGILVAYIVNFGFQDLPMNWRWMLGVGALPGIALAVAMLFVPYTPRWLVQQGRTAEARAVVRRTRPETDADAEVDEIAQVLKTERAFHPRQFFESPMRRLLLVGIVMAVAQQAIGVNTVLYFGATVLEMAGLPISTAVSQAVFIGVTNFVFAGVAVLMLDRVGRRIPMIVGTLGSVVGLLVLGWYFSQPVAFQQENVGIALGAMLFYLAFFEISLGPIFWVMIAEIYPLRSRAKAMAVATMFNWAFNFLVSFFFLQMTEAIGAGTTFVLYAACGVAAALFFIFKLPETKNRTLEEIEQQVAGVRPDGELSRTS